MKKGDITGLAFLFLMLGGLAAFFMFAPDAPEVSFAPLEVSGSSLTIEEAQGSMVQIDASIQKEGFITIHEAMGVAPGKIIGVSDLLKPDAYTNYVVSSEHLESGVNYFALLIVDDGDGVYEPGIDRPVMVNGEVVKISFTAK